MDEPLNLVLFSGTDDKLQAAAKDATAMSAENMAELMARFDQWQGNPLEWRVSWAAL